MKLFDCFKRKHRVVRSTQNEEKEEEKKVDTREALNDTQKNMIKSTMELYFEIVSENLPPSDDPSLAARVLLLMLPENKLSGEDKTFLGNKLLPTVQVVREILTHDFPQNRVPSSTSLVRNFRTEIQYRDSKGNLQWEPIGMLGLTPYNDTTAPPVTQPAVVNYIRGLIEEEKLKLLEGRACVALASSP